jgi:exopolysaccharide production protein ExoQ
VINGAGRFGRIISPILSVKMSRSVEIGQARASARTSDGRLILPMLVCVYVVIISPLISFVSVRSNTLQGMLESQWDNRIVWPVAAASSVGLALLHYSRGGKLAWPPHIICLVAYVVLAGASVLWAFRPELSFIRFVQQVMILTSVVLPIMLLARSTDFMRGLFLCFLLGLILNALVLQPQIMPNGSIGYQGYVAGKNGLGQFAAIALLLAVYEALYPGPKRVLGIVAIIIAASLLFLSNSKTAFGLACLAPILAILMLTARKKARLSPAVFVLGIVLCYEVLSLVTGFNGARLSYMLYGDATFTGRTFIWDFVISEIKRYPALGWGYQSFWLVGPDAPSVLEAPGWVKGMPHAHNGYLDLMVETGLIGFATFIAFIFATLHAAGHVADRDPARAWLVLSIMLFIMLNNFLETSWMHGGDLLWVMFVVVAAEIGRHWQPLPSTSTPYGSSVQRSAGSGRRSGRGPFQPRPRLTRVMPIRSTRRRPAD